jgi:hypothetical protein
MRFIVTTYDEHRGRDASEQLVVKSCLSPVEGGENSSFRACICFDSTKDKSTRRLEQYFRRH